MQIALLRGFTPKADKGKCGSWQRRGKIDRELAETNKGKCGSWQRQTKGNAGVGRDKRREMQEPNEGKLLYKKGNNYHGNYYIAKSFLRNTARTTISNIGPARTTF